MFDCRSEDAKIILGLKELDAEGRSYLKTARLQLLEAFFAEVTEPLNDRAGNSVLSSSSHDPDDEDYEDCWEHGFERGSYQMIQMIIQARAHHGFDMSVCRDACGY